MGYDLGIQEDEHFDSLQCFTLWLFDEDLFHLNALCIKGLHPAEEWNLDNLECGRSLLLILLLAHFFGFLDELNQMEAFTEVDDQAYRIIHWTLFDNFLELNYILIY